jgi:hypothetical protein
MPQCATEVLIARRQEAKKERGAHWRVSTARSGCVACARSCREPGPSPRARMLPNWLPKAGKTRPRSDLPIYQAFDLIWLPFLDTYRTMCLAPQSIETSVPSAVPLFSLTPPCCRALPLSKLTLDDTRWLDPKLHIYCDSKEPWTPIPEGSQKFGKMPA